MEMNKAIEILDNERSHCGGKVTYAEGEICEVYSMAMNALEKQIPKKPLPGDEYCPPKCYTCPCCELVIDENVLNEMYEFCPWCGQAIDWSDDDERN